VIIALILILSLALVWVGYILFMRFIRSLQSRQFTEPETESWPPDLQPGAEGIAFLYAHEFVPSVDPERISPRNRTKAPMTGDSLDARRWTEFLLYAFLADHYLRERIDIEVVESPPTFMPPLPHKQWSLQVGLAKPLPPSPLSEPMEAVFSEVYERSDETHVALDELLERMVRHMRRNITLWRKTGFCDQILKHVQQAMAHLGYFEEISGDTVLERLRPPVFRVVEHTAESLESAAEALKDQLSEFERWHSLPDAVGDAELLPGGLDPRLAASQAAEAGQWMADCLRLSVYEAVTSLRQLEPSDEFLP